MGSLAIVRLDAAPADELARRSSAWADAPLPEEGLLTIGVGASGAGPRSESLVLGSFQRASEAAETARPILRRGSGGGAAVVGPGTVWMQLILARPSVLIGDCSADKLLNRYVRPLLRAITRVSGAPAHYFGRDWVSAGHRPVALLAFGHEAATGRSLVEAILAVRTPFAAASRPSFLTKEPATLAELSGRPIDPRAVGDAVAVAYRAIASEARDFVAEQLEHVGERPSAPPTEGWAATRQEAIGVVGAGRDESGRIRVGGELMASRDAISRLEELVASLPPGASKDDVGAAVDAALAAPGVVTFGVRSLESIRDVIVDVLRQP